MDQNQAHQAQQATACKTAWAPPTPGSYGVLRGDKHKFTYPSPNRPSPPPDVQIMAGRAIEAESAQSAIVAGGVTLSIVSLSESIDMLEQQVSMLIDACMPLLAIPADSQNDNCPPLPRPSCAISERLHTLRERIDNASVTLRDTRLALAL